MKKAIFTLATPLLLAATAANAASIIKTDNSSLDIFGRAKFTATNNSESGSSSSFSPRFGVKGQIEDGNGTSAFFRTGWDMQSATDKKGSNLKKGGDNIKARYQFVGLGFEGIGKFTFGQNDTPFYTLVTSATDIFQYNGLEASAGTYGYNWAPNEALYSNTFGRLTVQASYQFKTQEGGNSDNGDILDVFDAGLTSANFKTQNNAYSAAASYALTDALNLRAGYAFQTFTNNATKSNYGLAADYTVGNLYFAGVYTHNKEDDGQNKASRNGYEVAASYNMDKYTFRTGYAYGTQDSDVANNDISYAKALKLGVDYHIFSNVTAMTQITHKTDGSNSYYGGLKYTF
ncbi:Porin-like protein L precursor [Marinomonas spartinae]|uniref:porin n=1 Tax=Marinomonas spartinae TaxID=1792290 RepID=UPI00080904F5|nr:porin [Marinomonas spartinae]SBS38683.1 Porin-like protein L precursor [Marinomonas spartinae]